MFHNADDVFKVRVSNEGVVTLESKGSTKFKVVASTFPLGASRNTKHHLAIFQLPREESTGLLIVYADEPYFILVDTSKEQPIDLKHGMFYPIRNRIFNFFNDELEVVIDSVVYTSREDGHAKNKVNADLLCRYIFELISAQAVIDAACDAKRETDALAEVAELRKEVEKLKNSKAAALGDLQYLIDKVDELRKSRLKMYDIIKKLLAAQEWKLWGAARRKEINDSITRELLI